MSRVLFQFLAATRPMLKDERGVDTHRDTSDVVIVHGGAAGADMMMDTFVANLDPPIKTESHPVTRAMWQLNPRVAGYMRNAEMVDLGARVCLAFQMPCRKVDCPRIEPHKSHGSSHCADYAEAKGITTIRVEPRA